MQSHHLALVVGAQQQGQGQDNLAARTQQSAALGSAASVIATALASESGTVCPAASAASGMAAAAVDHVSDRVGLPCYLATSLGSALLHWTRRW